MHGNELWNDIYGRCMTGACMSTHASWKKGNNGDGWCVMADVWWLIWAMAAGVGVGQVPASACGQTSGRCTSRCVSCFPVCSQMSLKWGWVRYNGTQCVMMNAIYCNNNVKWWRCIRIPQSWKLGQLPSWQKWLHLT